MNRLFDAVLTTGSSTVNNTRAPRHENDNLQIALDAARALEWQPTREQRVIEIAQTAMCRHDFGVAEQAISAIDWEPVRQQKQEQLVDFLVCARQFDDALDAAKAITWPPIREQKIKKISEYASKAMDCPTNEYPYSVCN